MTRAMIAAIAFASLAPSCSVKEQMQQANEDMKKAKAEIQRELGVDAELRCDFAVTGAGKRLDVAVQLARPPPHGSASEVKELITTIVKRNFRQPVTSVVISM